MEEETNIALDNTVLDNPDLAGDEFVDYKQGQSEEDILMETIIMVVFVLISILIAGCCLRVSMAYDIPDPKDEPIEITVEERKKQIRDALIIRRLKKYSNPGGTCIECNTSSSSSSSNDIEANQDDVSSSASAAQPKLTLSSSSATLSSDSSSPSPASRGKKQRKGQAQANESSSCLSESRRFLRRFHAEQEKGCSICLCDYSDGDHICFSHNPNCTHFFHIECITDWLITHDVCPYCREDYLAKPAPPQTSKSSNAREEEPETFMGKVKARVWRMVEGLLPQHAVSSLDDPQTPRLQRVIFPASTDDTDNMDTSYSPTTIVDLDEESGSLRSSTL